MLPQERSLSQTANTLLWPEVDENQHLFSNTHPDNSFLDGLVSTSSWPPVEEYPLFELPLGEEEDTSLETTPSLQDGLNTDISQTTLDALPFHSPSPGRLVNAVGVDGFERPGDMPNLDAFARDNMIYHLPNTSHVAIWLARLNGTIAQHLASISSYPLQSKLLQAACLREFQSTKVNPLAEVLQSTFDFVRFVQALRPSSSSSPQPASQEQTVSAAGPTTVGISPRLTPSVPELSPNLASLDIPTILMLVAGHMQLIQVYDALFGRAYITLRDMSPEFIATSLVFPALELGGYPVLQCHLQMKTIIQVVEYQLGQIERLIGFPAEYCLNGAQDSSQGILNNVDSSMLLQAIMSQIRGPHGDVGISHLASLKGNIQKVQELLQR
jgi:hypothetical protein